MGVEKRGGKMRDAYYVIELVNANHEMLGVIRRCIAKEAKR